MKIIISPSKTMKDRDYGFTIQDSEFKEQTDYLYHILQQYNDEELSSLMKISSKQSQTVYEYYHTPSLKRPALSFYQGMVFKQLELDHYSSHLDYLDKHLIILSAYYGPLHYNTGIDFYRLDMTMKPHGINLYEYWHTLVYQYFKDEDFIISLASKEFSDMVKHPHLYCIDFIEIQGDKLKRQSTKVKKARGMMLNQMILNEIKTLDQLKTLTVDGYYYSEDYSHDHSIAFIKYQ